MNAAIFTLQHLPVLIKKIPVHLFANANNPALQLQLGANYYLISNYLYFSNFYQPQQEGTIFNVLRLNASKTFRLGRHFNWYSDIYLQQKAGNADLNIPLDLYPKQDHV
jgi:DNA/RNA endonuclease G (NUC1)